ncbi:MAG: hypothetical protein AAGD04_08205 [Pseudomonadota bacterium]
MSELEIPKGEHGLVRLFSLEMSKGQATQMSSDSEALADALGAGMLDVQGTQVIPIEVLDDLGLYGFLRDAVGLPEDALIPDRAKIEALTGFALVVRSSAFQGLRQVLTPVSAVSLVGTYAEAPQAPSFQAPLESASAEPNRDSPEEAAIKAAKDAKSRTPWGMTLALLGLAVALLFAAIFGLGG